MNALLEAKDALMVTHKPAEQTTMLIPAQNGEEMFIVQMDAMLQLEIATQLLQHALMNAIFLEKGFVKEMDIKPAGIMMKMNAGSGVM
jgi:hypothetical protein